MSFTRFNIFISLSPTYLISLLFYWFTIAIKTRSQFKIFSFHRSERPEIHPVPPGQSDDRQPDDDDVAADGASQALGGERSSGSADAHCRGRSYTRGGRAEGTRCYGVEAVDPVRIEHGQNTAGRVGPGYWTVR